MSQLFSSITPNVQRAAFGAGCFWGTEKYFRKEFGDDLRKASVGYMGGAKPNPSYEDVCTGTTGHAEVFYAEFVPATLPYEKLVQFFYEMHDPTTKDRQGNDRGTQYRSAIFYYTPEQLRIAEEVTERVKGKLPSGWSVKTTFEPARDYYEAEEYHQRYLEKVDRLRDHIENQP